MNPSEICQKHPKMLCGVQNFETARRLWKKLWEFDALWDFGRIVNIQVIGRGYPGGLLVKLFLK